MKEKDFFIISQAQLYNVPLPLLIIGCYRILYYHYAAKDGLKDEINTITYAIKLLYGELNNLQEPDSLLEYYTVMGNSHAFSINTFYKLIQSRMKEIGIDMNNFTIKVPAKKEKGLEGMTPIQYSNYILGYKILDEYFKDNTHISYYSEEESH